MKAVLLIHGFATNQNDFSPLVPYLWSHYDEVICPNLPAHGKGTETERLDHQKIIGFVEKNFDELAAKHSAVDVIGFSMGGALATMLACTRKVNRLVLLAPALKYLSPWFAFRTITCFWAQGVEKRAIKNGKVAVSKYNMSSKELRGDLKIAAELFRDYLLKKIHPQNLKEFDKVVKHCNESLCEISCPTLTLWGKLDQLVPYASIKRLSGYCINKSSNTIIYPDISHIMLYSKAKFRICDDILSFLHMSDPPKLAYAADNVTD